MSQIPFRDTPTQANYQIGGALNFGNVPAMDDYGSAYANALNLNKSNYSNILQGYQNVLSGQMSAQKGLQAGYTGLGQDVLNDIQGIDASQRQAIADQYAQQRGAASQGLISRGLGNTTVQNAVDRGLALDNSKANIALSNQTAQLQAGYRSQLGLAGLNYGNQANMQNTALAGQQLGFMNSVNSPYPNAAAYAALAQQRGMIGRGAPAGAGAAAGLLGARGMGTQISGGTSGAIGNPQGRMPYTPESKPAGPPNAPAPAPVRPTLQAGLNETGYDPNAMDPYDQFMFDYGLPTGEEDQGGGGSYGGAGTGMAGDAYGGGDFGGGGGGFDYGGGGGGGWDEYAGEE